MNNKSKVAVIGLGTIGTIIASNLIKGKHPVIIADRNIEKAKTLSTTLGEQARPETISTAIAEADIIIFAVWFNAIKELFNTYSAALQGKIIIDPSNPIAPDEKGGFKKIIEKDQSAGEILAAIAPANTIFVKAFGTLGAASLTTAAFKNPDQAVLFYAADDTSIKNSIEDLIHDSGFEPLFVGGIDQSIKIEVFGELHEFGALGEPVSLTKALGILKEA